MEFHRTSPLRPRPTFLAGLTAALALLFAPEARAGIDACGDIHVEAEASCEVMVEGGCEARCEPVRMEAACAAELTASCQGQCNELPSVECSGSCQADCSGECEVDPGAFECRGACNADCQGQCDAYCSSSDSECRASCEASCSASCEGSCDVVEPSATCEARCDAMCEGSCEASANLECQVDCQADGYVDCKATLEGGCRTQCQQPEGALFCDGQYVDHGGNLEACVAALRARLDIEVEGYAEGQCAAGRCEGEAGGSVSCSVAGPRPLPIALTCTLLGLFAVARRRRE